jgi:hypothetical protein
VRTIDEANDAYTQMLHDIRYSTSEELGEDLEAYESRIMDRVADLTDDYY